jgi:hypothetical protein
MKNTFLIQRLLCPRNQGVVFNRMAFGGGGEQFSEGERPKLAQICTFDYMGAAEFEYGAVPEALDKMREGRLVSFSKTINKKEVYILCQVGDEKEVSRRLELLAKDEIRLKEPSSFDWVISGMGARVHGWLELDNGFLFTVDENMMNGFMNFFAGK